MRRARWLRLSELGSGRYGPGPVEGGPPRVLIDEIEDVEVWGIVDFPEREQLVDDLEARRASVTSAGN